VHKILTTVQREKIQGDKVIKERIDSLPEKSKWKQEHDGKEVAEFIGKVKEM
jgi:hypothetical protein